MDDYDPYKIEEQFCDNLQAMFPRELGTPVSISDRVNTEEPWETGFYVVTPDFEVLDVTVFTVTDPELLREVLLERGTTPQHALDEIVLASYGARQADFMQYQGANYTGLVFPSLKYLTDWAHAFRMEQYVSIVGTPQLSGAVSVNVAVRAS